MPLASWGVPAKVFRPRGNGVSWWEVVPGATGAWEGALAVSQELSYLDRTGNGNNLTPTKLGGGAVIDWASGVGWSGFRTNSSVLYTGIVLSGGNNSIMIQIGAVTGAAPHCIMGCASPLSGHTAFALYPYYSESEFPLYAYQTAAGLETPIGSQDNSTMALCGIQGYLNGELDGAEGDATGASASPIAIGGAIRRTPAEGVALDAYSAAEALRAIIYPFVLDATQVLAIHTAMMAITPG